MALQPLFIRGWKYLSAYFAQQNIKLRLWQAATILEGVFPSCIQQAFR
mgnify:CR=1 FL=1